MFDSSERKAWNEWIKMFFYIKKEHLIYIKKNSEEENHVEETIMIITYSRFEHRQ